MLTKMKKTAEDYLGETVTEAVITVPAYFNDSQRQATKDAGRIAGLERQAHHQRADCGGARRMASTRPAAIARSPCTTWAAARSTFRSSRSPRSTASASSRCCSTNGDTFLGGEDFDKRIINFIAEEFQKESGVDVRRDPLAMQRLKEASEKAKIELSSSQQTDVNLPYITADATRPEASQRSSLTRAKLESLVEDLVRRPSSPCKTALKDAGLSVGEVGEVILVGGQTRMPLVQKVRAGLSSARSRART